MAASILLLRKPSIPLSFAGRWTPSWCGRGETEGCFLSGRGIIYHPFRSEGKNLEGRVGRGTAVSKNMVGKKAVDKWYCCSYWALSSCIILHPNELAAGFFCTFLCLFSHAPSFSETVAEERARPTGSAWRKHGIKKGFLTSRTAHEKKTKKRY